MIETNLFIQPEDLQFIRDNAEYGRYRIVKEIASPDNQIEVTIRMREIDVYNLFYVGQKLHVDKISKLLSI